VALPNSDAVERALLDTLDSGREELMEFVSAAVRIPSVTGEEGALGKMVADWLAGNGIESYSRTATTGLKERLGGFEAEDDLELRPNVFAWVRGEAGGQAPLVISTHQDVVSPGDHGAWARDPWSGDREGGRIFGRGATDMKGSIGAALFALRAVHEAGVVPPRDVEVQCVFAEESGGLGTLSALETEPLPAAAVVLEPSECAAAAACSGCLHFTVTVEGRSAHAATPWMGVSALEKMIAAYGALEKLAERRRGAQDHPLFSSFPDAAPFSIGVARAGEWRSTVAERAVMIGRLGIMPGESLAHGRAEIVDALHSLTAEDEWLHGHPPVVSWDNAGFASWDTDPGSEIVETVTGAAEAVLGPRPLGAVTYGSDAGHFAQRGVPVVIFGPGRITDAHAPDESVSEDDVLAVAKALALTIVRYAPGPGA
jgi:acetylornithine deacetylase